MGMTEKRNILVIPGYNLFPMMTGGALAQCSVLEGLQYAANVFCVVTPKNVDPGHLREFKDSFPGLRVLEYGFDRAKRSRPPSRSARIGDALRSLRGLLRRSLSRDAAVPPSDTEVRMALFDKGAATFSVRTFPPPFLSFLEGALDRHAIDVVSTDFPVNLTVRQVPCFRGVPVVFVHHEIKYSRVETQIKELDIDEAYGRYRANTIRAQETCLLSDFDRLVVFAEEDREILARQTRVPIDVSPFGIPSVLFADESSIRHHSDLDNLVLVGGESHLPNKIAAEWFIEKVYLPLGLAARFTLKVVGKWRSETVERYAQHSGIRFLGFVDDIARELQGGVLISPVNVGGGLRTKIMLALAQGAPVVATEFSCQGLGLRNREECLFAEEPREFADLLLELANDKELRQHLRRSGFQVARERFGSSEVARVRLKTLEQAATAKRPGKAGSKLPVDVA